MTIEAICNVRMQKKITLLHLASMLGVRKFFICPGLIFEIWESVFFEGFLRYIIMYAILSLFSY